MTVNSWPLHILNSNPGPKHFTRCALICLKTEKRPEEQKHPPTKPKLNALFCLLGFWSRKPESSRPRPLYPRKEHERSLLQVLQFTDQETGSRQSSFFFFFREPNFSQNCLLDSEKAVSLCFHTNHLLTSSIHPFEGSIHLKDSFISMDPSIHSFIWRIHLKGARHRVRSGW